MFVPVTSLSFVLAGLRQMNMAGVGLECSDPVANPPVPERIDPVPLDPHTDYTYHNPSPQGDKLMTSLRDHRKITLCAVSGSVINFRSLAL